MKRKTVKNLRYKSLKEISQLSPFKIILGVAVVSTVISSSTNKSTITHRLQEQVLLDHYMTNNSQKSHK